MSPAPATESGLPRWPSTLSAEQPSAHGVRYAVPSQIAEIQRQEMHLELTAEKRLDAFELY